MRTKELLTVTALAVTLTTGTAAAASGGQSSEKPKKRVTAQAVERTRERCGDRDVLMRDRASGRAMVLPQAEGPVAVPGGPDTRFTLECADGYLVDIPAPSLAQGNTPTAIDGALDQASRAILALASKAEVVRGYGTVFTGLHVRMGPDAAERVRGAGYSVWENGEVRPTLAESVPQIRADQVWSMKNKTGTTPYDGRGVRIAILDTGIDYRHADLGNGCYGLPPDPVTKVSPCKVAGGYDVINQDADPMDDHGHGTHVAAIAAGNGNRKGVAPGASLYAYKVIGATGSGSLGQVIEGIERAIDPNRDGAVDDRAHVLNLSLGASGGSPDDPLAQAVDNAVAAGSTVAVAAGNSSWRDDDYENITTPGLARRAITVGASAKEGWMALFSSRGPVRWADRAIVKPDVAAPGVAICAAQHADAYSDRACGSKHISLSGTSMASPHVAGVAALLLQARPTLTAEEVKSTIKGSAVPLGSDTSTVRRGSGRVDALNAVTHGNMPPVAALDPVALSGATRPIAGVVRATSLRRWTLEAAPFTGALSAEAGWTTLATATTSPVGGVLHNLRAATLADGAYVLRLTVEDSSGRKTTDHGYTSIDKIRFATPLHLDVVRGGGTVTVEAAVDIPLGTPRHTLEVGAGDNPGSWTAIGTSASPRFTWSTDGLSAERWSLRLTSEHDGITERESIAVELDPRLRPGWPVRVPVDRQIPCLFGEDGCMSERGWLDPVPVDVDTDGETELLTMRFATTPEVRAYRQDGTLRWSTPLGPASSTQRWALEALHTPVTGDVDGDGRKEIFAFNVVDSTLYQLSAEGAVTRATPISLGYTARNPRLVLADLDGNARPELVLSMDWARLIVVDPRAGRVMWDRYVPGTGGWFYSVDSTYQPAVADLDGDGKREIVAVNGNPGTISTFDAAGRLLWSRTGQSGPGYVPPVIGNLDGAGGPEVIAVLGGGMNAAGAQVQVLSAAGTPRPGWPVSFPELPDGGPALGDVDGNGRLDLVINSSTNGGMKTRVFGGDGTLLPGWPINRNGQTFAPPVLGDAAGGTAAEIVVHENGGAYGKILAFDAHGTSVPGLAMSTERSSRAPIALLPLRTGRLGIVAASDGDYIPAPNYSKTGKLRVSLYLWETGATYDATKVPWGSFQRDEGRAGAA